MSGLSEPPPTSLCRTSKALRRWSKKLAAEYRFWEDTGGRGGAGSGDAAVGQLKAPLWLHPQDFFSLWLLAVTRSSCQTLKSITCYYQRWASPKPGNFRQSFHFGAERAGPPSPLPEFSGIVRSEQKRHIRHLLPHTTWDMEVGGARNLRVRGGSHRQV